jgi:hypothetical protein
VAALSEAAVGELFISVLFQKSRRRDGFITFTVMNWIIRFCGSIPDAVIPDHILIDAGRQNQEGQNQEGHTRFSIWQTMPIHCAVIA